MEIFWVAVGAIATAAALVYTLFFQGWLERRSTIKNLKKALYFELLTNIEMLFTGEVERRPLFDVITLIRKDVARYISDQEGFFNIQKLYAELDYYQTFVQKVYLNPAFAASGRYTTEKQISTMNKFLEYFGVPTLIYYEYDNRDQKRDEGIVLMQENIEEWKKILKIRIDRLF